MEWELFFWLTEGYASRTWQRDSNACGEISLLRQRSARAHLSSIDANNGTAIFITSLQVRWHTFQTDANCCWSREVLQWRLTKLRPPFSQTRSKIQTDGCDVWKIWRIFSPNERQAKALPQEKSCCRRYLCASKFIATRLSPRTTEIARRSKLTFLFRMLHVSAIRSLRSLPALSRPWLLKSTCVTVPSASRCYYIFDERAMPVQAQIQGRRPSICHLSATCHLAGVITGA